MHRYEALSPGEVRADSRRRVCVATVHCLSHYTDLGDELSWYRTQGDQEIRQPTLITKATEIWSIFHQKSSERTRFANQTLSNQVLMYAHSCRAASPCCLLHFNIVNWACWSTHSALLTSIIYDSMWNWLWLKDPYWNKMSFSVIATHTQISVFQWSPIGSTCLTLSSWQQIFPSGKIQVTAL